MFYSIIKKTNLTWKITREKRQQIDYEYLRYGAHLPYLIIFSYTLFIYNFEIPKLVRYNATCKFDFQFTSSYFEHP